MSHFVTLYLNHVFSKHPLMGESDGGVKFQVFRDIKGYSFFGENMKSIKGGRWFSHSYFWDDYFTAAAARHSGGYCYRGELHFLLVSFKRIR